MAARRETRGAMRSATAGFAALLLAGCELSPRLADAMSPAPEFTPPPAAAPEAAEAAAPPAPAFGPRPETRLAPGAAFRISDLPASWDGAETAGGLWVALPYLPAYERVLVRNPETGETVVARLFWRDAGSGEAVLSSSAAKALGLGPGRAALEATVLE